jgi:hypothetical protein
MLSYEILCHLRLRLPRIWLRDRTTDAATGEVR